MAGRLPAVIIPVKFAPLIAGRVPVIFAAGTLVGFDSETVTRLANKAAGIVVGHIGTSAITIPELKKDSN